MAVSGIRNAVRAALAIGFTTHPVVFENETYAAPTSDGPWVSVEVFGGEFAQQSIGVSPVEDNRWDERGIIMAHIFVPSGTGMDASDAILEALSDVFRGQELDGGYEMRDMDTGPGNLSDEGGLWWRTTLTIEWIKRGA